MNDPRKEPGYVPGLLPSCDGQPFGLVPRTDRWWSIKARFLFAFYRINVEHARLIEARRTSNHRSRPVTERPILQAIERAIVAREALEDRYASRGWVAFPLYLNGFVVNVTFQHPGSPAVRPFPAGSSASQSIAFALPSEVKRRRGTT